MTIFVRFTNGEICDRLRGGVYELPDGATVATLMAAAQSEAGLELSDRQTDSLVFVFDNSPATGDTALRDGGKLRVMNKILGG